MPALKPKISVIIPALNEANYIADCLTALAAQTFKPFEIIVIDNNSADETAIIAAGFPGVKVLHEPKQSRFLATHKAFLAAKGNIIARTDADSRPDPDWLASISKALSPGTLSALTGPFYYHDLPFSSVIKKGEAYMRAKAASRSVNNMFLAGANMAILKKDWQEVEPKLCGRSDMHEDIDLAIHLQDMGKKIGYDPAMRVATSARRLNVPLKDFYKYMASLGLTYKQHQLNNAFIDKIPLYTYVPLQPLFKVIYRLYNSDLNQVTLSELAKLRDYWVKSPG